MAGNPWHRWGRTLIGCVCLALSGGCQSNKEPTVGVEQEKKEPAETESDLSFLVAMNWGQAKALSAHNLEMPPSYRLAAEQIDVLKASPDGAARRVRARGKVFIDLNDGENGRVLCQEAYIWNDEMILRGKPMLRRGSSLILGLDDSTVFYMMGTRVQVIGRHRVGDALAVIAASQSAMEGPEVAGRRRGAEAGDMAPGAPLMLPVVSGPWSGGPNPLLPPLSVESVPEEIRQKMRSEAGSADKIPLDLPKEEPTGPPEN